jgi:hypothetical protein
MKGFAFPYHTILGHSIAAATALPQGAGLFAFSLCPGKEERPKEHDAFGVGVDPDFSFDPDTDTDPDADEEGRQGVRR